jgi:sugar/nucleoside kinase (ribokinase family)
VSRIDMLPARANHLPDVVGLGHCAYDILAITPGLPEFDDVKAMHLADLVYDGGGQVGTALTTLARLGTRTSYIGLLGDDDHGHFLHNLFVQNKVDTARLRMHLDVGTNVCLILVEQDTGRRAMFCHRKAPITGLVLEGADRAIIHSARVLHLDGQFTPAAIQAAHWAREAGVKVCFDGNHPRPRLDELLPLVDWLVVAEPFPAAYTDLTNPEEAARALLCLGAEVLVVTQGEHGCQVWTTEDHFQVPGFDVTALDTTGAGDAFHGAFIHAMLQGWDLYQVARFSNAVAAINCQTLGGRRGLPTLSQVEAFLAVRPG